MSKSIHVTHLLQILWGDGRNKAYLALQTPDKEAFEDLARFVAVADIFEGFGGILAGNVEEDFFATTVRRS
jgi:hypothetical protein